MRKGDSVLIAGGSGGLGRAVAEHFAKRGIFVFSGDIKPHADEREGIRQISMDVTSAESVEAALSYIKTKTERLQAVIYLAGVYMMDSFVEVDERSYKRMLDINLLGAYRVNKAFLPLVRDGGRFVIITSELAAHKALPFNGLYSLSKTSLQHYADSLRLELSLLNVPVVVVRPGAFKTDMVNASHAAMQRMTDKTALYKTNAERFKRIMNSQTGTARDPSVLAKTVWRAASAKKPRLQYTVNAGFLLWVYNLLPKRVALFAIKRLISK